MTLVRIFEIHNTVLYTVTMAIREINYKNYGRNIEAKIMKQLNYYFIHNLRP